MTATPPDAERRQASIAVIAFPVVVIVVAVVAPLVPALARPITPYVPLLLGFIMFTMGLTLTLPDLKVLRSQPWAVVIGVVLQYTIMPLSALGISVALHLEPMLVVGMVLLGCVPGGTASNIVTYLANGNVALSVAMTAVSTLVSPLVSPLLVLWLAGSYLPVDAGAMVQQILQIVLIPVVLGVGVQLVARPLVERVAGVVPWLSIAGVALVLAGVMAKSSAVVLSAGAVVFVAGRSNRLDPKVRRVR